MFVMTPQLLPCCGRSPRRCKLFARAIHFQHPIVLAPACRHREAHQHFLEKYPSIRVPVPVRESYRPSLRLQSCLKDHVRSR